jgi:hypothetical protein
MPKKGEAIDSMEQLQRRVPSILKRINADPWLALRAAANPILVLDELGYELTPKLRAEVELRVRFPPEARQRLAALATRIHELAGESFDLDSPEQLEHVLFRKLKLPRPAPEPSLVIQRQSRPKGGAHELHPLAVHYSIPGARFVDPLEALRGQHPLLEPLLEYRALQARHAPLAPPALYARIKRGEDDLPKLRLRARLQRAETPD